MMAQYKTELLGYKSIVIKKYMGSWLKEVKCIVQSFKNGIAITEPFEFVDHDLTFAEIGQLCGGN
jgi:hypothetical protein